MRKYITKASERIGVESTSRDGKRAQVVSYSTCENFIIRFCDGKEMKLKNWRYFIEGNFNYEKHFKAPRNREERIGEKKVMNNGLTAEVIEYRGSHDMDILFEDGGKRTGVSWRDFCIGSIAHPTIPGGNVSQNELVLRFYLESLGFVRIPQRSKRSDRVGLEGKELDLYNDKLKIAIEYDGEYSHTKNKDDEGKNKIVEKLGIKLYRFREPGCSGVSGRNYILEDSRFMSASLECCLKSFVRDVLKKDDKFINFEKDKRTIKEYVSNNKRVMIHLYEKKKMNNGMVAEIIKMSSCRNITVQFEDGEIVYHKCYQSFVKGNISHPKDTSLAKKNQRLNIRKQMKNGMMAEVIEYNLSNDIKVKFDNGEIVKTRWERFSTGSVLNKVVAIYVSFFRSTPMLSQLFFFYFAITPFVSFLSEMKPITALIIVMSMNEAAFMSETIRGALSSIDKGQREAGLSIGMTELKVMRRIVIPQAFRVALPGLSNSFISLIKGSSLGFTIGVIELMSEAKLISSKNFRIMEAYAAVLIVYWVVIALLTKGQKLLEQRINKFMGVK